MGLGLAGICDLCRILVFLNVLYAPQQLGNRTLPRTRPEPWMANAPMRPAKAASGRFCRSNGCVNFKTPILEHLENIISATLHKFLTVSAWYPSITPEHIFPKVCYTYIDSKKAGRPQGACLPKSIY